MAGWLEAPLAAVLALGTITSAGCAFGNKHQYHDIVAPLQVSGTGRIAVATYDRRDYVLSGRKKADFVGLSRGGYGNPFDVTTESGRPLPADMTNAIVASLAARGFQGVPVTVASADDAQVVRERLIQADADRAVLLILREWKSDTFQNTALNYDVSLQVLDHNGRVLAEKNAIGKDNLGGSFWNPPAHAKTAIPVAFRQKLADLLNDAGHRQRPAPPRTEGHRSCSPSYCGQRPDGICSHHGPR